MRRATFALLLSLPVPAMAEAPTMDPVMKAAISAPNLTKPITPSNAANPYQDLGKARVLQKCARHGLTCQMNANGDVTYVTKGKNP